MGAVCPVWHTAQMGSTTHREVATSLTGYPLPVEAGRVAATGWQVTRTAVRFIGRLPKRPWQKVIKELLQTFADLGPTYVKFGQIIASSPGAFGESLSREFRGLLDRVPPAKPTRCTSSSSRNSATSRPGCSPPSRKSRSRRRPSPRYLRDLAQRRGGGGQDPAAGHPPPRCRRPADPQALRADRRTGQAGPAALGTDAWCRLRPGRGAGLFRPSEARSEARSPTTPRRFWAKASGCRRCTGTSPPSGC